MWMTTKALFPELIKVLERRNNVPSRARALKAKREREPDRVRES